MQDDYDIEDPRICFLRKDKEASKFAHNNRGDSKAPEQHKK